MTNLWLWVGLAIGEVFLVVFILLLVAWLNSSAQARRDRKAAKQLIAKVKQQKADREKILGDFLQENYALEGDALRQHTIALLRGELALIQRFADVYASRDAGAAAQFTVHVEEATVAYQSLRGSGSGLGSEGGGDAGELEALRLENTRLSEELSVTMDTMSRMLSEYSTMFSGGDGASPAGGVMPDEEPLPEVQVEDEAMEVREAAQLDEQELDIGETSEASLSTDGEAEVDEATVEMNSDEAGEDRLMGMDEDDLSELLDGDDVADLDDSEDDSVAI